MFYVILLHIYMSVFVCIFYINNTAKGNTSLMLTKLLPRIYYDHNTKLRFMIKYIIAMGTLYVHVI